MGMYTELIFGAELKKDTPKEVIDTLLYMVGRKSEKPDNLSFDAERNPLTGGSYYFGVNECVREMWYDDIRGCFNISTRSNIKNYNNEIGRFLEWIEPYIEKGSGRKDMYAIVIYEEQKEPTIYYLREDE